MKIVLFICFLLSILSCKNKCSNGITLRDIDNDSIYVILEGGILDKYDNGRVYYSIYKIKDPYTWEGNEYFTGVGFSDDRNRTFKVLKNDSCDLINAYLNYKNKK